MIRKLKLSIATLMIAFISCIACACLLLTVRAEVAVNYVTGEDMYANAAACQPELGVSAETGGVDVVQNGMIVSNDGKFAYDAEVEGIDVNIKFTKANTKQIFFVLRATAAGSPWSGGKGYYALIDGTSTMKVQVYKVDGVGDWNDECLLDVPLQQDIFDGGVYNLKFAAKEDSDGFVQVSFSLNDETAQAKETTAALPIEGTYFYTMNNGAGSVDYQILPNYTPPTGVVYTTVDDMLFADKFYDGYGETANKISSLLDTVSSVGGKLVYDKEVAALDLDIQFQSGNSVFFVLRATKDLAVWEGGLGYFFMVEKTDSGNTVKLIKGIEEEANENFKELSSVTTQKDIFSGKQNIRLAAADTETGVALSFEIGGETIIEYTDSESDIPLEGSHFAILPGTSIVVIQ